MKNRVPRKVKKWHKKRGYRIAFLPDGTVYFTRTVMGFILGPDGRMTFNGEQWPYD